MNVTISSDAEAHLLQIAESGDLLVLCEVAKTFALLKDIANNIRGEKYYWDDAKHNNSLLNSCSTLKGSVPIWRVYPNHLHCIALLVEINNELRVLGFCSQANLSAAEIQLIETY